MEITLSEKQKKFTLKAQKKAKTPKNVLTSSLPEYWPTLNAEKCEEFSIILHQLSVDESLKKKITLKLDRVINDLSKFKMLFLLLDDDFTPRWFAKHFLCQVLTQQPNVKILIIPGLKEMATNVFKTATVAIAINEHSEVLHKFHTTLNLHDEFLKHYGATSSDKPTRKRKSKILSKEETPIVHLPKKDKPAFVPENIVDRMEVEETGDFISLKKYDEPSKKTKLETISFFPMKIKQVLPNPNRKKKWI